MGPGDGPPPLSETAGRALKKFRQGDVVEFDMLPVISDRLRESASASRWSRRSEKPWWKFWSTSATEIRGRTVRCPEGLAVVISQSCDLTNADRLTAQIAPLVRLAENEKSEAKSGRRPRYVAVPQHGDDAFVDLESIATVDKIRLANLPRRSGVLGLKQKLEFARGVGRRFSRFAFPDEVVPALSQLQRLVKKKHGGQGSLGKLLDCISMFRVEELGDWAGPKYRVSLHVIVREGVLPYSADDEPFDEPEEARTLVFDSKGNYRPIHKIADAVLQATEPALSHCLWGHFADAMADCCMPDEGAQETTRAAVEDIDAQVFSIDEYTMLMYQKSVELDLDYLSEARAE